MTFLMQNMFVFLGIAAVCYLIAGLVQVRNMRRIRKLNFKISVWPLVIFGLLGSGNMVLFVVAAIGNLIVLAKS